MSERQHLDCWLRIAPHIPRTGELVRPDGGAYCWLGGAALAAALHPDSDITLVEEDGQTADSHFLVGDASEPDDDALCAAMAAHYGVDLWEVLVEPERLPRWLAAELAAALDASREHDRPRYEIYDWAREGGGWPLASLSDLGVGGWLLAALTRTVVDLYPAAMSRPAAIGCGIAELGEHT